MFILKTCGAASTAVAMRMKSKGKTGQLAAISLLLIFAGCLTAEARLAPAGVAYDRQAVVNEAYYSLSGVPYSSSIGSSTWNYLASNPSVYWHTRDLWGQQGVSGRYYPIVPYMTQATDLTMRQYFVDGNIPAYGRYKGYLRGGQCKYFANLVLYRAGVSNVDPMPTYAKMQENSKSSQYAKPGDVLFKKDYHTAIVTRVITGSSSAGTVSSVEVVDSNWVGGAGQERIGLHTYSGSSLAQYRIWAGAPYFSCSY